MFAGIYFNGQSSKGYACSVSFTAGGILIAFSVPVPYTAGEVEEKSVLWDTAQIHEGNYTRTEKITLKYGGFPNQYLQVDDAAFFESLKTYYPNKKFNARDFEFLRSIGARGMAGVAIAFLVLVVISYFFLLPPIAEFGAEHMPVAMETKLGGQAYNQLMENASVNQPLTKEANRFWRALNVQSPYLVNITVIHEDIPNAFSLPGGQIIVYDGIIKQMKDYDEFAALLAHEYAHAFYRHGMRSLSRSLAGYIFISVLLNDASGTFAVLATNANTLKGLSFSRDLEHQADAEGLKFLQSKNIPPNGMLKLFTTLKGVEGSSTVPRFISNHPLTTERMDFIKAEMKKDTIQYINPHQDLKEIWAEMKADE